MSYDRDTNWNNDPNNFSNPGGPDAGFGGQQQQPGTSLLFHSAAASSRTQPDRTLHLQLEINGATARRAIPPTRRGSPLTSPAAAKARVKDKGNGNATTTGAVAASGAAVTTALAAAVTPWVTSTRPAQVQATTTAAPATPATRPVQIRTVLGT